MNVFGKHVSVVARGHCRVCGVEVVRFVLDGKLGHFHADPVCPAFVEQGEHGVHVERAVLNTASAEFSPDKGGTN